MDLNEQVSNRRKYVDKWKDGAKYGRKDIGCGRKIGGSSGRKEGISSISVSQRQLFLYRTLPPSA